MMNRVFLAALACAALSAPARADYVTRTYLFDQSNTLPDMLTYGSVTIEAYDGIGAAGGGLAAGQVRLTLTADPLPVYGPVRPGFGIRAVGFNTDLTLSEGQISMPSGWKLRPDRFMGGFGRFAWQAHGKAKDRQDPLVVTINELGADAALEHFLIPSATSTGGVPPEGPVYFAARIGGFDLNDDFFDTTRHVVGTGYPMPPPIIDPEVPTDPIPGGVQGPGPGQEVESPEPSTLLLAALGAAGLCAARSRRRRGLSAPK